MQGQWRGNNDGENAGEMVVEIDDLGDHYEGSAYLHEANTAVPAVYARVVTKDKSTLQEISVDIHPLDPRTEIPVPFQQIAHLYPEVVFPAKGKAAFEFDDFHLRLTWETDIGTSGSATLPKSQANQPSECPVAPVQSWSDFRELARALPPGRLIFRGQPTQRRLRTAFHRTGRANLDRYMNTVMPAVHRHLSATTRHFFDVRDPLQNAAFFNLIQHHGFPTPLLDWTNSPFVAAHFAFTPRQTVKDDFKVRIYIFDRAEWCRQYMQVQNTAARRPHFSIIEALAIDNPRMVPQQALLSFTNVDDIESYITSREKSNVQFLTAVDLPYSERPQVLRELRMMGITAGSLFPGLDGTCAELRERFYPDY